MREDLEIKYQNERVKNPCVATLEIVNTGIGAIPSESFDKNRGLIFSIAVSIIKILSVDHKPSSAPRPEVIATDGGLELKPELIVTKETITVSLLTEGQVKDVSISFNPLADVIVDVRDRDAWQRQRSRLQLAMAGVVVILAVVIGIITGIFSATGGSLTTLSQAARQVEISLHCIILKETNQTTASEIGQADLIIKTAHDVRNRSEFLSAYGYAGHVAIAAGQARLLAQEYRQAANSGVRLGGTSDVPTKVAQAVTILARLPREGTGTRANSDLALVSDTLNRLSGKEAIPQQCQSQITGS
jgi:hypothetical protein